MRIAGGVTAGIHNEGGYSYSPSLNDKDDKNDKESEKSPMRVIAEVYGNLVILVMEKLRVEKSPKMQTHYSNSGRNETLSRVKTIVKESFVRVDTL